jgi:hypothetical protein
VILSAFFQGVEGIPEAALAYEFQRGAGHPRKHFYLQSRQQLFEVSINLNECTSFLPSDTWTVKAVRSYFGKVSFD